MIEMSFGTQVFGLKVKKNVKNELVEHIKQITLDGLVKFAEAAAAQTPLYTGYTRAMWGGVMNKLFELGALQDGRLDLHGYRPWFYPYQPVADYSNIIVEDPYEQQAKGLLHGYRDLVVVQEQRGNILVFIEIIEYDERGGENYVINEPDWQTLAAGRMAFNAYYKRRVKDDMFEIFDL